MKLAKMSASHGTDNALSVCLNRQIHTFLYLARFQNNRVAGASRRLLGVEPKRGHLDILVAGMDELQIEGAVDGCLDGRVVVAVFEAVGGAGTNLAVGNGFATAVDDADRNVDRSLVQSIDHELTIVARYHLPRRKVGSVPHLSRLAAGLVAGVKSDVSGCCCWGAPARLLAP
jgi:hypothetical protein